MTRDQLGQTEFYIVGESGIKEIPREFIDEITERLKIIKHTVSEYREHVLEMEETLTQLKAENEMLRRDKNETDIV